MKLKILFTSLCVIGILSSCSSYKNMAYLKGVETLSPQQLEEASKIYSPKIMPGDLLTINVNALNPTAAVPFNLPLAPVPGNGIGGIQQTVGAQTYVVNSDGSINFPVLGQLFIAGYTREAFEQFLKAKIYPQYITEEPIVNVRFVNYSISVLGEVNRPGTFSFASERVNLFEVLAAAGDLTIYGRRDNILLKRENANGSNQYVRLNLQDKNLALSPYFYLQQNDVIYIEPNKARGNSSSIGSTENLSISVVSILISVATLVVSATR